ncbi:MAG: 1-(5-phosphoribosyl)-5-[(5-phosphoribosylamino)methylideneamino]imidazole-4-carboxamide isomerase [Thermomicrobiales bacterium]
MIVYPAIDIRGGRCVRLVEGDFDRETAFDADPVDAAKRWIDAGAEWLHVVDLDAARSGQPENAETLKRLRDACAIHIQYGGGLRTLAHLQSVFDIGVDRAVLGTAAINDDALVTKAADQWGKRIAAGLDARDGYLAGGAWTDQTSISAERRASELHNLGIDHLIFTDIRRDGTLKGPNIEALGALMASLGGRTNLIASGGIGSLADVTAVGGTGATGVIIGRALYDGRIDLPSAIRAALSEADTAP